MVGPVTTSGNGPTRATGHPAKDSGAGTISVVEWVGDPFPALQWLRRGDWLVLRRRIPAGYQSGSITTNEDQT